MRIRFPLLAWQFRPLVAVTALATSVAGLYVLLTFEPLRYERDVAAWFFILIHCIAIAVVQGRYESRSFGFLYSQGFSRDTLWAHSVLASAASVLIVWLPVAVLVLAGLRNSYQEASGNYWYPLMSGTEWPFAFWSLLAYAVLLPIFRYAWIRAAQPVRGGSAGVLIAVGAIVGALSTWNGVPMPLMPRWTVVLMAGGFVLAAASLFLAGWRLHRRMEVRC